MQEKYVSGYFCGLIMFLQVSFAIQAWVKVEWICVGKTFWEEIEFPHSIWDHLIVQ